MANETTTTSANDLYTSVLHQRVLEEVRPLTLPLDVLFTRADPAYGAKGITAGFPIQADPGAAAALTEGTDASNTQLTTDIASATAVEQGIMATVTDRLAAVSIVDAYGHFGGVLVRSVAERHNDIFAALIGAFSNESGSTGADLTVAQFVAAAAALAGRDIPGPYNAVLHPQQVYDLRNGSGGILPNVAYNATSGFGNYFYGSPQLNQSIMDNIQRPSGPYVGQLQGVDIYETSSIATANNAADRAGGMFSKDAIGYHALWSVRVERQRDASLRATELVATSCIGGIEVRDAAGQALTTDA